MGKLSRQTWGWALNDWANSAFAVSVLSIVFPLYFKTRLATSGVGGDGNLVEAVTLPFGWTMGSEALWPFVTAVSMFFVVLITPVVGAVADYAGKKKGFLLLFCMLGASSTGLMVLLTAGTWKLGILFFIVANVCFVAGNVVYNGLLIDVAASEEDGAFVSGFGWASVMHDFRGFWILGLLGGLVLGVSQSAWRTISPGLFRPNKQRSSSACVP